MHVPRKNLSSISDIALQDTSVISAACDVLGTLRAAAADAVTTASEAAGGSAPAAEEAAAMDRLQGALQAYNTAAPSSFPSLCILQRQVVPPARQLAAALLDWWRRPSAQQEQQLQATRAAAARSCAHLGCAYLSGNGVPAAGEGVGSKRCRWGGQAVCVWLSAGDLCGCLWRHSFAAAICPVI